MHHLRVSRFAPALLVALGFCLGTQARAQLADTEPNSSCLSAQDLGSAALPVTVSGSLDTPPGTPDVDFYRLKGTPDELILIDQTGSASGGGTLADPFLGVFTSSCDRIAYSDADPATGNWQDARLEVRVPADGVLVVAASSAYDWDFGGHGGGSGSYTLSARKVAVAQAIGGRLADARTGAPVTGAWMDLMRCWDGYCTAVAGGTRSGDGGLFRFDAANGSLTEPVLRAGSYQIVIYPPQGYVSLQTPIFEVAEGQDFDLGDVAVTPVEVVGSIRGRLVDAQTGAPVVAGSSLYAYVELQACPAVNACYTVTNLAVDAQGRFVFQSEEFRPILAGTYRLVGHVDQYYDTPSEPFEVGDGQHFDAGDVAVRPFPVRLTLERGCGPIPSAGGECRFEIGIVNGTSSRLEADSWTLVRASSVYLPFEVTQFQAGGRKSVKVAPGATAVLPHSFTVPAALPDGTTICARVYTAEKKNPFLAIGIHDVFCLRKGEEGFAMLSEEDKREVLRQEQKKN